MKHQNCSNFSREISKESLGLGMAFDFLSISCANTEPTKLYGGKKLLKPFAFK